MTRPPAPPQITGASIIGKKLFVQGLNFDAGARIILNEEEQKKIGRGQAVRLKVLNSDGTESAEFSYTRPSA
ncbi:MAG TPA: hypothetical protein VKC34_04230 [Blastocatellia bacterium]|nr:hypothetical protein [Blastocatellia bacterium]